MESNSAMGSVLAISTTLSKSVKTYGMSISSGHYEYLEVSVVLYMESNSAMGSVLAISTSLDLHNMKI